MFVALRHRKQYASLYKHSFQWHKLMRSIAVINNHEIIYGWQEAIFCLRHSVYREAFILKAQVCEAFAGRLQCFYCHGLKELPRAALPFVPARSAHLHHILPLKTPNRSFLHGVRTCEEAVLPAALQRALSVQEALQTHVRSVISV